jgi:hypothetical protein
MMLLLSQTKFNTDRIIHELLIAKYTYVKESGRGLVPATIVVWKNPVTPENDNISRNT